MPKLKMMFLLQPQKNQIDWKPKVLKGYPDFRNQNKCVMDLFMVTLRILFLNFPVAE